MLKIKIALLASFSLLLFSCNTKSKEEKATEIKTEEHQHSESETIQLNNGEKWKVDDNMMLHIRNMEKDIIHFEKIDNIKKKFIENLKKISEIRKLKIIKEYIDLDNTIKLVIVSR